MTWNSVALLIFSFGAITAHAAAPETKPEPQSTSPKWRGYIGIGPTFSPKTDYTFKYQGTSLGSVSNKDKSAIGGSAELEAVINPVFSTSMVFDYSSYKYTDGTANDTELSLMVMPKARANFGLWAGLGLGLIRTGIGTVSSTSGTATLTLDESSITSFGVSPRIGYDFEVKPGFTLGASIAYMHTSADISSSYVDVPNSLNIKITNEFSRSWWIFNVRAGFDL